jgi:NADH dehydrogenase [ubiquinone] 1 alpha subcomplex assembly factor 1
VSPATSSPTTVVITEPSPETTGPAEPAQPAEPATPATSTEVGNDRVVTNFAEAGSIEGWSNVDDTVMGGVSASTTSWDDGRMVFAGDLSLENNGGFTSVRSPQDAAFGSALDGAGAIGVVAEGDGKTYVLQLRAADDRLYIARFETVDGEQRRYELPLDGFEPVTRFLDPDPGSPPLEPSSVVQLAIYLLDGQVGPFRLAVSALEAIAPTPV